MPLPSINLLYLTISEIQPKQDLQGQGHCRKIKGSFKVTPWHCTPTPLKMSLTAINNVHLMVSQIQPRQDIQTEGHCKVTG